MRIALLFIAGAVCRQVFSPVSPERVEALRFGAELPAFEAKDVLGRMWRLEELRGKYTLVYLWHTFAARGTDGFDPHVVERFRGWGMPDLREVERVYQDARRSRGIQVLTFCTDYDYMHAHDYLRERQYSFPVIADRVLATKLVAGASGSGMYLVVNPEGRISDRIRSWSFSRLLIEAQRAADGGR